MRASLLLIPVLLSPLSLSHALASEPVPRPTHAPQQDRDYRAAFQKARTAIREKRFDEAVDSLAPLISRYSNRAGPRLLQDKRRYFLGVFSNIKRQSHQKNADNDLLLKGGLLGGDKPQAVDREQKSMPNAQNRGVIALFGFALNFTGQSRHFASSITA